MGFFKFVFHHWKEVSGIGGVVLTVVGWVWRNSIRQRLTLLRRLFSSLRNLPQLLREHAEMQQRVEQLVSLDTTVKEIAAQLRPNGGGSIADSLARLEASIAEMRQTRWAIEDINGHAFLQTDARGEITLASSGLSDLLGVDQKDIMGNGWVTAIHQMDRKRIFSEWSSAITQQRRFDEAFRVTRQDTRVVINVRVKAVPLRDAGGKLLGYVGVMNEEKNKEH